MRHDTALHAADRSLDELLFHFRALARKGQSDWERSFARSILRHSKRPGWKPSAKQESVMQRLVAEMFSDQPDIDLIDTDEGGREARA